MAIFLVQHGLAASKDVDPEKGLSPKGVEETSLIAGVAKGYEVPVKKIFHSGKKRARQTADIFQTVLGRDLPMDRLSGINPMDDVRTFSACIDPSSAWMVVGHLPFMERLVSFLTTGSEETLVYRFQNSGIACLDARKDDGQWNWFIKWTLSPNIS